MDNLTFDEFARRYCERQECEPDALKATLNAQKLRYAPTGWMLLECQVMDSSRMGSLVILPYGPSNTWKEPPTRPISPRGLASDMSTVAAILLAKDLPA